MDAAPMPGPGGGPADDTPLVERAADGEAAAFDELVLRHQDRIYAVCLRMLRDAESARDAAQEAFLKAWKALPRFEGRSRFSTWLHRIAMNVCLSMLRSNKAHPERRALSLDGGTSGSPGEETAAVAEPASGGDSPEADLERSESRAAVTEAIAGLEEDFRQAVVLRDIQGMAYDEIADILQIPVGTVRSRIHRGREQLRNALESFVLGKKTNAGNAEPGGASQ